MLVQNGANFTATLDGNPVGIYNTASVDVGQFEVKVIFTINSLEDTSHTYTLVLEKAPNDPLWVPRISGNSSLLSIDSITTGGASDSPVSLPSTPELQSSSTSNFISQSTSLTTSDPLPQLPSFSTPNLQSQSQFQSTALATSTPQLRSPSSPTIQSTGGIAGIVISVFAVIALIVALIWYRRHLTRVTHPFTVPSPFMEAGMYLDDKRPEQIPQSADPLTMIPSSSALVQKQAVALVPTSSSLERGTAAAETTSTNENNRLGGENSDDMGLSSIPLPSRQLQSSSATGGMNVNVVLQVYSILRDQVRHLVALQRTGSGLGMGNEGESHSDYHEPPPVYVERDGNESYA